MPNTKTKYLLNEIHSPANVKALDSDRLAQLAEEIRERILTVTSRNGGHIGPNLGVVELTLALHRIFDSSVDRIVMDVAHQGYAHKLLTGRNDERFDKLRQNGGICGFLNCSESAHDAFGAGHAGTALSAALGMAAARDKKGSDEHVIALCGDAAFTCGTTMEALNNIASTTKRLIVILNDNKWSIAKNVGALARYFNELITNPIYNRLNDDLEALLHKIPGGPPLIELGAKWKQETKDFFVSSSLFEKFGLRYIGPIDGHDLKQLEHYLEFAKKAEQPILLHVLTVKGKGYDVAINQPERFHGCSPFDIKTGKTVPTSTTNTPPKYQDVFGQTLVRLAKEDKTIVGITAAMPAGTGLNFLEKELPDQFFDVGIAEAHSVLFAAGLASQGFRPVCAIYSTFLQRAYDQIIHDVALQNLPVVFCMDRAGLSPNDGPTHHGLFDIAYLRCVPNVILMAPANEDELADMLFTSMHHPGPVFIRYPRGQGEGVAVKQKQRAIPIGKAERLAPPAQVDIWALGTMLKDAKALAQKLTEHAIQASVVNARVCKTAGHENTSRGSPSQSTHRYDGRPQRYQWLWQRGSSKPYKRHIAHAPFSASAWPDRFIDHGSSVAQLRTTAGLDPESILKSVLHTLKQIGTIERDVVRA